MYDYAIHPTSRLGVFTARGDATRADWRAAAHAFLDDPEWVPGWNVVIDIRNARLTNFDYRSVRAGVARERAFDDRLAGARIAVLVDGDAEFGLVRMWQALANGRPVTIAVFRDPAAALRHVGVTDATVLNPHDPGLLLREDPESAD